MTLDRWVTVLGVLASGLFSWLVSRYFYRRSDKRRIPTFVIKPGRTPLSQAGLRQVESLAVLHEGRQVGAQGITEAQVYFWNSGTLPILKDEILEPFTLSLPVSILHYSVLKSSREVVGFQVSASDDVPPRSLAFHFSVLEPGDGATIRVIYDGPLRTQIEFTGACLDAPKPMVLPPDNVYFTSRSDRIFQATVPWIVFPIGAALVFGLLAGVVWVAQRFIPVWLGRTFLLGALSVLIGSILWHELRQLWAKYVPPDIKPE
jgi:hypothetical protein